MASTNGKGTLTGIAPEPARVAALPPAQPAPAALRLERIEINRIEVPIVGVTPLIVHAWSEKARNMMANPETVKRKKGPRDPEGDFEAARYRIDSERDGFPAVGFKAAMVGAARLFEGATMTALKQWLFVVGEGPLQLVPIHGTVSRREDMVRVGQGTADIRWRPQYDNWSATLLVEFVASAITPSSVLALVDAAGIGGVGEWRPSSPKGATGSYGRFKVADVAGLNVTVGQAGLG